MTHRQPAFWLRMGTAITTAATAWLAVHNKTPQDQFNAYGLRKFDNIAKLPGAPGNPADLGRYYGVTGPYSVEQLG